MLFRPHIFCLPSPLPPLISVAFWRSIVSKDETAFDEVLTTCLRITSTFERQHLLRPVIISLYVCLGVYVIMSIYVFLGVCVSVCGPVSLCQMCIKCACIVSLPSVMDYSTCLCMPVRMPGCVCVVRQCNPVPRLVTVVTLSYVHHQTSNSRGD